MASQSSSGQRASKIPSWIMVGFILGLVTFYSINNLSSRPPKGATPAAPDNPTTAQSGTTATAPDSKPVPAAPEVAPVPPEQLSLFLVDALFRKWEVNAMWDYNTTEVLFWNPADNKYSIPIEVKRSGDEGDYDYFYRMIPRLTKPIVPESTRKDMPLAFTENEEATKRREERVRAMWQR